MPWPPQCGLLREERSATRSGRSVINTQVILLVRRSPSGVPEACPRGLLGSEHYHRVRQCPAPGKSLLRHAAAISHRGPGRGLAVLGKLRQRSLISHDPTFFDLTRLWIMT